MDEEKTIDESVETEDERTIEPAFFDDMLKDAPRLRDGGDPDPADMNMIHKHLDNFLAMLCGETPIDDNVRTSTEYWLKRLADGLGGSTKKIYLHPIDVYKSSGPLIRLTFLIFNNDATAFTKDTVIAFMKDLALATNNNVSIPASGCYYDGTNTTVISSVGYGKNVGKWFIAGNTTTGTENAKYFTENEIKGIFYLVNDGVNAIN